MATSIVPKSAARRAAVAALVFLAAIPLPVSAQEEGMQEIIVTAQRREADNYDERVPAVGLRRTADFAVVEVSVAGDTREKDAREAEIYDMVRGAIQAAPRFGVELAYGDTTLTRLTPDNYRDLTLTADNRPDSQRTSFFVKVPLGPGMTGQSAQAAITRFVKAVKPVGRAQMKEIDDMTLSIVAPDSYRNAIADIVAADAKAMAARVGPEYGVEIEGLNRPVEWTRAGLSEVLLYIPYRLVVRPKS